MSHYTGHFTNDQVPRARVALFGVSLVAVGLLGFYSYQQRKHERMLALDKLSQDQARISSWEYRLLQRDEQFPFSSNSPGVLRASRVETRTTPLSAPVRERDSRHRTVAEDASALLADSSTNADDGNTSVSARSASLEQPTAQRGHPDGRGDVYTKNPGWREQAHYASGNGRKESDAGGMVDREAQKIAEVVESVEEKVKSLLGKGKGK